MGMPAQLQYTAAMVRRLNAREPHYWPRYEVVDGELLVTPAPRKWHYEVAGRIEDALKQYLGRQPIGRVYHSPSDISWGKRKLVQPDVFVLPMDEARKSEWRDVKRLLLIAEVLGPRTEHNVRYIKRRLYQLHGVPLYWIIDPDAHAVECWTPEELEPRIERDRIVWHPEGASGPFELRVADLFRPL
jgi:Uma2 family endonuclease